MRPTRRPAAVAHQVPGGADISHLGRTSYTLNFTFAFSGPNPGPTLAVSGAGTLVAANGDQLFVTFTATVAVSSLFPAVVGTSDVTITGGTGRFSDASGTFTATGHPEVVAVQGTPVRSRDTVSIRGRISY